MGAGGALRAFFLGAREDAARAAGDSAAKAAEFGDATARNIRDSVAAIRNAEDATTDAASRIRPPGSTRPPDGTGSRIWRMLNPEGSSGAKAGGAIDSDLEKVNPKFDPAQCAYRENCTSVVQAYELRRRGRDVQAGPLERHLWSSEAKGKGKSRGGRPAQVITDAWGGEFTPATRAEIEEAFKEPGARGVVGIVQNGIGRGQHVFNVENEGGRVRFIDAQFNPPVTDASHYFGMGHGTAYVRLDNRPAPPDHVLRPYLEP